MQGVIEKYMKNKEDKGGNAMRRDDLDKLLERKLRDPEVKKEYEALEPEFDIIQAIIDARKSRNMTQKELAERTGIDQADISKLENGYGNPTLGLLKRLAEGMDMVMKLEFIPKRSI